MVKLGGMERVNATRDGTKIENIATSYKECIQCLDEIADDSKEDGGKTMYRVWIH